MKIEKKNKNKIINADRWTIILQSPLKTIFFPLKMLHVNVLFGRVRQNRGILDDWGYLEDLGSQCLWMGSLVWSPGNVHGWDSWYAPTDTNINSTINVVILKDVEKSLRDFRLEDFGIL